MNHFRVTDWFSSEGALGLVAGAAMAVAASSASALTFGDAVIGTTSIYDGLLETYVVPFGTETLVTSSNFDAFFDFKRDDLSGTLVPTASDLLISDFATLATILSGSAEDWTVDAAADTLSILYKVTYTDLSLTAANYVVAVLDFSGSADLVDPFDLFQVDFQSSSVSVFEVAPIPLPAGAVLLVGGLAALGLMRRKGSQGRCQTLDCDAAAS